MRRDWPLRAAAPPRGTGLILTGGADTFTGTTVVNGGTLTLNKTAPAIIGQLVIGGGTGGVNSDIVSVSQNGEITGAVTINSTGALNLNTFTATLGAVIVDGGNLLGFATPTANFTDLLTLGGNFYSLPSAQVVTVETPLTLNHATIFNISASGNANDVTIAGQITGAFNLTKIGGGVLTYSSPANGYSGQTTVDEGTLILAVTGGTLTQNGTTTNASTSITGLTSTANLAVGMLVTGAGIAAGTSIASITSTTGITLSANATASATVALTFSANALGGTLVIGDFGSPAAVRVTSNVDQFPTTIEPVIVNGSGTLDFTAVTAPETISTLDVRGGQVLQNPTAAPPGLSQPLGHRRYLHPHLRPIHDGRHLPGQCCRRRLHYYRDRGHRGGQHRVHHDERGSRLYRRPNSHHRRGDRGRL